MCVGVFLSFFQAAMIAISVLLGKESISMPIYIATDVIIFSAIIFLQILTIYSSNALHNESTFAASSSTNKKTRRSQNLVCELCYCYAFSSHHTKSFISYVTSLKIN